MAGVLNKILSFAGIYQDNAQVDEYEDEGYEYADNDYQYEEPSSDGGTLNEKLRGYGAGRTGGIGGSSGGGNGGSGANYSGGGASRVSSRAGTRGPVNNVVNLHPQKPQNYVLVSAKPDRLEDAQLVCEHLKDRHVVIVNVEGLDGREAQRIVDFIGGAVFALDGEIFDITNRIFTVAPNNVDLVAIKRDPKNRGFLSFGNSGSSRG